MDFVTATILSGITYDVIKTFGAYALDKMKARLMANLVPENDSIAIAELIEEMKPDNTMSELAIQKMIENSPKLMAILEKPEISTKIDSIQQNHSGVGDNIINIGNKN